MGISSTSTVSPLSQRLWRWHFFAGLIVCPFAILLSITGAIYLFKPQIDNTIENRINLSAPAIQQSQQTLDASVIFDTLIAQHTGAILKSYQLAKVNDRTVEIELLHEDGQKRIYWVDIYSAQVLHSAVSDQQFLSLVKKIHSELLLGNKGSYFVELMASWLIILIITGVYLWLAKAFKQPKKSHILQRMLTPRLKDQENRKKGRNLHGVIGLWFTVPILVILLSGLPWTQLWGSGFKKVQAILQLNDIGQEWFVTLKSTSPKPKPHKNADNLWEINSPSKTRYRTDRAQTEHGSVSAHHSSATPLAYTSSTDGITLSEIEQRISSISLTPPIRIQPPISKLGVWTVRSMPQNRSQRTTLHYDRFSGDEIMRIDFSDHNALKRFTAHGVSLHEGALFGWLNQLLGLLTAIAIIVISIMGFIIWWLRKPENSLGAPEKVQQPLSKALLALIIILGILLPAAGISILIIAFFEYIALKLFNR